MSSYRAAVFGANGLTGRELVKKLLADVDCSYLATFARQKIPFHHPKLEQIEINYDQILNFTEKMRVDRSFCCLGSTRKKAGSSENLAKIDRDLVVKIARLSSQLGVSHFSVLSSIGADASSPIPYLKIKGEMEKQILEMPFRSLHIFRPSLLLGERLEKRALEKYFQNILGRFQKYIPAPWRPVKAETLAAAVWSASNIEYGKRIIESEGILQGADIYSFISSISSENLP